MANNTGLSVRGPGGIPPVMEETAVPTLKVMRLQKPDLHIVRWRQTDKQTNEDIVHSSFSRKA